MVYRAVGLIARPAIAVERSEARCKIQKLSKSLDAQGTAAEFFEGRKFAEPLSGNHFLHTILTFLRTTRSSHFRTTFPSGTLVLQVMLRSMKGTEDLIIIYAFLK